MTVLDAAPQVAEMGILLRELNHRINDQLASAINLISVEAVRAEGAEAKAALSNAVELLHGHASVHRALLMPQYRTLIDATAYLRKLASALRGALLEPLSIQLTLDGDRLPLQPERCWRLGLIVHELVTNASKYACFDGRPRRITIKLARTDELVNCVVSDSGSGATRIRDGQGLRIVRDLARSLVGRVERGAGVRSVVLSFALTERERQAICAIDTRRLRPPRQVKPLGLGRRRVDVSRAQNVPPPRGGELASHRSTDALGELLSSSHSMDAI